MAIHPHEPYLEPLRRIGDVAVRQAQALQVEAEDVYRLDGQSDRERAPVRETVPSCSGEAAPSRARPIVKRSSPWSNCGMTKASLPFLLLSQHPYPSCPST